MNEGHTTCIHSGDADSVVWVPLLAVVCGNENIVVDKSWTKRHFETGAVAPWLVIDDRIARESHVTVAVIEPNRQ